jgi:hypothetical protein
MVFSLVSTKKIGTMNRPGPLHRLLAPLLPSLQQSHESTTLRPWVCTSKIIAAQLVCTSHWLKFLVSNSCA